MMDDRRISWDDAKAAMNYAKHGVRFEAARAIFNDPSPLSKSIDRDDYAEERFILIGMAGGRLLAVVYT